MHLHFKFHENPAHFLKTSKKLFHIKDFEVRNHVDLQRNMDFISFQYVFNTTELVMIQNVVGHIALITNRTLLFGNANLDLSANKRSETETRRCIKDYKRCDAWFSLISNLLCSFCDRVSLSFTVNIRLWSSVYVHLYNLYNKVLTFWYH